MNKLANLRTREFWMGQKEGNLFKSNTIKLDFNINDKYSIDGRKVKIVRQSTDNMYRVTLEFEEV